MGGRGIKTAILDLTQNRNAYYIYTRNEENLRTVAFECMSRLVQGEAKGIKVNIVVRPNNKNMLEQTYVVFDFETTGFNAGGADSIIEIGAVKIKNGEILETFANYYAIYQQKLRKYSKEIVKLLFLFLAK